MSIPLKDLRLGITESIDIMLEAQAAAFGIEKQAVARQVLADWAKRKAHEHRVIAKRLAANGMQPELFGDETADDGVSRSSRK